MKIKGINATYFDNKRVTNNVNLNLIEYDHKPILYSSIKEIKLKEDKIVEIIFKSPFNFVGLEDIIITSRFDEELDFSDLYPFMVIPEQECCEILKWFIVTHIVNKSKELFEELTVKPLQEEEEKRE